MVMRHSSPRSTSEKSIQLIMNNKDSVRFVQRAILGTTFDIEPKIKSAGFDRTPRI